MTDLAKQLAQAINAGAIKPIVIPPLRIPVKTRAQRANENGRIYVQDGKIVRI